MKARIAGVLVAAALAGAGATVATADDPDTHYNYPPRPHGYNAIVDVFGKPCASRARENALTFVARSGKPYVVRFHRKLGGTTSTNMIDVRWHILHSSYDNDLRDGIWGYNCRYVAGTKTYSTHAWGIAVDINSAYEHVAHYHCHTVPAGLGGIWTTHNWYWGLKWGDCMHFQYATGY